MRDGQLNQNRRGWRVLLWCAEVGCGRSFAYELIKAKKIESVTLGAMRIITTSPREFLATLAEQQADKVVFTAPKAEATARPVRAAQPQLSLANRQVADPKLVAANLALDLDDDGRQIERDHPL